ncbi:MAG: nuclease-related domain-containing protein [Methylophilaceae bacterium]|nr:nuclease-related domain-containing protein [Methylophilaceae bacterium]
MTVFYLLLGIVIGLALAYLQRPEFSHQNRGEALVTSALQSNFHAPDYHLLNHITLKHQGLTTQIDHILVSRFGVFVIETKDYNGWIFANAKQDSWTQVMFRAKFKFQNPIYQNYLHVQAVQELLDFLPASAITSVVVFSGNAEFKTDMPTGVFTLPGLIGYLKRYTEKVLSLNRVQFCVGRIETARLAITRETDVSHVQALKRRYGENS